MNNIGLYINDFIHPAIRLTEGQFLIGRNNKTGFFVSIHFGPDLCEQETLKETLIT